MVERVTDIETIRELVADFDELLGVKGNFWGSPAAQTTAIDTPEQILELSRDLLVELFGLEVRGL